MVRLNYYSKKMESTFNIPKHLDNFRAYLNSFDNWKASTGEVLSIQEVIVTKNTFPSSFGIRLHPISELEKHRDLSRARWNITTSKVKDASATIDAYGIGKNETKVKFIDGHVPYLFPHERKNIGTAFSELIKMLANEPSELKRKPKKQKDTEFISKKTDYVDLERLAQLESIKSPEYDLKKLIQLCKEINIAHQNHCNMSIAMLLRAVIDHVPPIFKVSKFSEVANNYSGTKSFKKAMDHLSNSLRNIADSHLHVQIRKKEDLPTFNQVNFMADLDLLLSEIVRIMQ